MPFLLRRLVALVLSLGLGSAVYAAEKETLTVGYLPILDHLTLLVSHAQDNDNFSNFSVKPKLFKSWGEMVGALRGGRIDAAFILSPLAMDLFAGGTPIRTILLAHRDGSAITIKKGSGIASAQDLKGKSVAIPALKSTHTALLNKYLSNAGLSLKDITTKVIAPPDMQLAMERGSVDAFIVAEPFGAKAQLDNVGEILVLTKDIIPNHVECIVIVNQAFINTHQAALQEWTRSLIKAGTFIDQDKAQGAREIARLTARRYFPHSEETVIAGLQNPVDRISFSDLNPAEPGFAEILKISQETGLLKDVDLPMFIDNTFYQDATL